MKINRRQAIGTLFGIGGLASMGATVMLGKQVHEEYTDLQRSRLNEIANRGYLKCGINGSLPGFSVVETDDNPQEWPENIQDTDRANFYTNAEGFEVDICRAIAIAIFGETSKRIVYRSLTVDNRFPELANNAVDILVRNTSRTVARDSTEAVNFTRPYFYDEQKFLVRKQPNGTSDGDIAIQKVEDLIEKEICVRHSNNPKTTTQLNIEQYLPQAIVKTSENGSEFRLNTQAYDAFRNSSCAAFSSEESQIRSQLSPLPENEKSLYRIIPNPADDQYTPFAYEQWAIAVSEKDEQWLEFVDLIISILLYAESIDLTSSIILPATEHENIGDKSNQQVDIFLKNYGWASDPRHDFAPYITPENLLRIISQVGNYGEIYQHNLIDNHILPEERGPNQLWTKNLYGRLDPF